MTSEELKATLVNGAIVSFDTNAGMGRSVLDAARKLERIGVRVELSVIMVGEHIRQEAVRHMTRKDGRTIEFKVDKQLTSLTRANIAIAPISEEDALSFHRLVLTLGDWDQAKRMALQKMLALDFIENMEDRVQSIVRASAQLPMDSAAEQQLRHLLGLPVHRHGLLLPSLGKNRKFPATADWWIRTQAERRGWIFVTDDQGEEWADLPLRVTRQVFDTVLAEVVPELEL